MAQATVDITVFSCSFRGHKKTATAGMSIVSRSPGGLGDRPLETTRAPERSIIVVSSKVKVIHSLSISACL